MTIFRNFLFIAALLFAIPGQGWAELSDETATRVVTDEQAKVCSDGAELVYYMTIQRDSGVVEKDILEQVDTFFISKKTEVFLYKIVLKIWNNPNKDPQTLSFEFDDACKRKFLERKI